MSYANFAPTYWAEKILRGNNNLCVLSKLANHEYEGEATMGGRVKIPGIGAVSIFDFVKGTAMNVGETLEDTSVFLDIDKSKAFNVLINDIDKAQSKGNIMDAVSKEASEGLTDDEDGSIGATLLSAKTPTAASVTTATLARNQIIKAKTALRKAGVKNSTTICAAVTPDFFELLEIRNEELNTNNSADMVNGFDAKVSGVEIYVSNNLPKSDSKDVIFIFTKNRAFAHVNSIHEVEAYRDYLRKSDGVSGLNCYGTKVVRPKELVSYKLTYTA